MKNGLQVEEITLQGQEQITIKPRLKGGTSEEKVSIICLNANGFPSDKNNWHKLK